MNTATKTLLLASAGHMEEQATALLKSAAEMRQAVQDTDETPALSVVGKGQRRAWTTADVATMLGLGHSTVKAMVSAGTIPSVLIGGARRVLDEDLRDYLTSTREQTAG